MDLVVLEVPNRNNPWRQLKGLLTASSQKILVAHLAAINLPLKSLLEIRILVLTANF